MGKISLYKLPTIYKEFSKKNWSVGLLELSGVAKKSSCINKLYAIVLEDPIYANNSSSC